MFLRAILEFVRRHEKALWWLHSAYALLLGVLVMWLGSRDFTYLRIIFFPIAFIWLSSFFLPQLAATRRLTPQWRERARLVVNYLSKNFYQQLLFFVLPVYYSSATFGSRNMPFVAVLAVSAVVSTLDIVYDRYLSVRWMLHALFFAFNLFVCVNVMLPVLWSINNARALWISGAMAVAAFVSTVYRYAHLRGRPFRAAVVGIALALFPIIVLLRPFIPPAPLRLASARFGRSVQALQIVGPITALPAGAVGKIVGLTAIHAPQGLREEVRHRWYLDGKLLFSSPFYTVTGGRGQGYRLWTQISWNEHPKNRTLVLDVETRGRQLIGRARLRR